MSAEPYYRNAKVTNFEKRQSQRFTKRQNTEFMDCKNKYNSDMLLIKYKVSQIMVKLNSKLNKSSYALLETENERKHRKYVS